MDERVIQCLSDLGVRYGLSDRYFRHALQVVCQKGYRPDDLYEQVAEFFGKSTDAVSRGIARVGRKIWDRDQGARVRRVLQIPDFEYYGPEDLLDHLLEMLRQEDEKARGKTLRFS